MQGKTIHAEADEIRKVTNNWTAFTEQRGSSVSASDWEATGSLTLGAGTLSGDTATVLVTVNGSGEVKNTVTLANGETLVCWRRVETD